MSEQTGGTAQHQPRERGPRPDLRPPLVEGSERDTQVAFLNYLRESVIAKVEGLPDVLSARPVVPSGTSLLGLVKHLTDGENHYVLRGHAGLDGYEHVTFSMSVGVRERGVDIIAAYREAISRANGVIAACEDLDERGRVAVRGDTPLTMRWVLAHLIEETGRHAGHADILRELIDGSTGR